jgi:hypothetical protein
MSTREPIDPRKLRHAISRAEAQEMYLNAKDPLEKIEALRLHEAASGFKPPIMLPFLDPSNNLWTVDIPSSGTHGLQKFRSASLEGLVSVLCTSQFYASDFIAKQNQLLKDKFQDDDSCYSVVDCGDFQ